MKLLVRFLLPDGFSHSVGYIIIPTLYSRRLWA